MASSGAASSPVRRQAAAARRRRRRPSRPAPTPPAPFPASPHRRSPRSRVVCARSCLRPILLAAEVQTVTRSRSAQRSVPLRAHGQLTHVDGDQTLVTVSAGPHNEAIAMWPTTSGRLPFFDLHTDSEWSPTRHYWHVALVQRVADHRWVHASIALVDDTADQLASLYAWLQRDDELRGRVRVCCTDR